MRTCVLTRARATRYMNLYMCMHWHQYIHKLHIFGRKFTHASSVYFCKNPLWTVSQSISRKVPHTSTPSQSMSGKNPCTWAVSPDFSGGKSISLYSDSDSEWLNLYWACLNLYRYTLGFSTQTLVVRIYTAVLWLSQLYFGCLMISMYVFFRLAMILSVWTITPARIWSSETRPRHPRGMMI